MGAGDPAETGDAVSLTGTVPVSAQASGEAGDPVKATATADIKTGKDPAAETVAISNGGQQAPPGGLQAPAATGAGEQGTVAAATVTPKEPPTLQETLEKLLSKKNLAKDQLLRGCINPQMYVPISDLVKHERLAKVSEKEIFEAASKSQKLGVDATGKLVRPMLRSRRNTIIVRDFPHGEEVLKNEILGRLPTELREQVVGMKADVCDTWFIKCASDDVTQKIALFLRDQEYAGTKIQSAIKSEHFLRSFFPVPANNLIPLSPGDAEGAGGAVGGPSSAAGVVAPAPAGTLMPGTIEMDPARTAFPPARMDFGGNQMYPGAAAQPMGLSPQPQLSWGPEMFPASPLMTQPVLRVLAQVNGGTWQPWGHAHRAPRKLNMPSQEWVRQAQLEGNKPKSWTNKWNAGAAGGKNGPPSWTGGGKWAPHEQGPMPPGTNAGGKGSSGKWGKDNYNRHRDMFEQNGAGAGGKKGDGSEDRFTTAALRNGYYHSEWVPRDRLNTSSKGYGGGKGSSYHGGNYTKGGYHGKGGYSHKGESYYARGRGEMKGAGAASSAKGGGKENGKERSSSKKNPSEVVESAAVVEKPASSSSTKEYSKEEIITAVEKQVQAENGYGTSSTKVLSQETIKENADIFKPQ